MIKWYCSSSLCFNNYTSRDKNGDPLTFYRLPISYTHWSCWEIKTPDTLPDAAVPPDQYKLLKVKYSRAKKYFMLLNLQQGNKYLLIKMLNEN